MGCNSCLARAEQGIPSDYEALRNVVEYASQPATSGIVQQRLACLSIVPLLHSAVLCRNVKVTQAPLGLPWLVSEQRYHLVRLDSIKGISLPEWWAARAEFDACV